MGMVYTIPMPESEKLTINLTPVDVGRIELLVEQGFYANRAEFIRTAIHHQLEKHADTVREAAARQGLVLGALTFNRSGLEQRRKSGDRVAIRVIGYLSIAGDVSPALAKQAIESVRVRGVFRASKEVKAALADRMV
jgi:Arc/MetJ-type ribon-helix-helix transcriptional regulator